MAGVGDYLRTCDGVDAAPSGLTLAHSTGLEERVILREMFGDDWNEEDICSQSRLKGSESGATPSVAWLASASYYLGHDTYHRIDRR